MTSGRIDTEVSEHGVAADELRGYVERIERLDEEAKSLNDDRKDIYAEAKGRGFDVKAMKKIIAMRRMDRADRQELEAIVEIYMHALGMS